MVSFSCHGQIFSSSVHEVPSDSVRAIDAHFLSVRRCSLSAVQFACHWTYEFRFCFVSCFRYLSCPSVHVFRLVYVFGGFRPHVHLQLHVPCSHPSSSLFRVVFGSMDGCSTDTHQVASYPWSSWGGTPRCRKSNRHVRLVPSLSLSQWFCATDGRWDTLGRFASVQCPPFERERMVDDPTPRCSAGYVEKDEVVRNPHRNRKHKCIDPDEESPGGRIPGPTSGTRTSPHPRGWMDGYLDLGRS